MSNLNNNSIHDKFIKMMEDEKNGEKLTGLTGFDTVSKASKILSDLVLTKAEETSYPGQRKFKESLSEFENMDIEITNTKKASRKAPKETAKKAE